uniref:Haloacid dehalogenase-like hydrolase domain-containing 5 n=1 Tax=Strigamia maritima TaxID=126957 RepID=T1IVC9_STRMM
MAASYHHSTFSRLLRVQVRDFQLIFKDNYSVQFVRNAHTQTIMQPRFGLLFDIDGVIVRGRRVLPFARDAFSKLVDDQGKFRVPTVFVTNAGNVMRHQKAQQLSYWLGVEVSEDQVVMSHSPLRMFKQFHNKHVLVSGQGPTVDIAKGLGFTKITSMDTLRNSFPLLDAVDHKRRTGVPCAFEKYYPRIEAVVMFGEPIRWETSLQLIIDVLMASGLPCEAPRTIPYPHIPLLACNVDLQWMAEACMPRFGHGAFLVCLENLYKKITGKELIYTALIGKPSEVTYRYAEYIVAALAKSQGINHRIQRLYAIGDNPDTDIYGANLYNRFLTRRLESQKKSAKMVKMKNVAGAAVNKVDMILSSDLGVDSAEGADSCESILVQTGVYNKDAGLETCNHSARDFLPVEEKLREASYTSENVHEAIDVIFEREDFH